MVRWIRARSVLSVLIALLLAATACESQPTSNAPTQDAPDPNGELVTNMGNEPDTIDPHKASYAGEVSVIMSVFEGLMTLDPRTLKPVPAMAAKDPEISADAKSWKFTLRPGLKFSDGTALTAKDFERGFLRTCDPRTKSGYAFVMFVIVGCEKFYTMDPKKVSAAELDAERAKVGVKAIDDLTITFDLREPAAYFSSIAYLWAAMPIKQESLDKGGDKWTEPPTYIGTGPFKLTEWQHSVKMVFERNENYWRGAPRLKKWTRQMINEGAVAFAAYRANDLDVVGVGTEDMRTVESDPQLKAQYLELPGSCTNWVGFQVRKRPFDDINVRIAFARSVDREAYVKDILGGLGAPANGGFIPPGLPGYDKEDASQRYDPAAAREALARSKYAKSEIQGLRFTYGSNSRTKLRVEWMLQQWKANLGVEVIADPVDPTALVQMSKNPETAPLFTFGGWCADFPHQQNWLTTVFHSKPLAPAGSWKNEEFDRLVEQADRETDGVKADALYLRASRILSSEFPKAWLNYNASRLLIKPWVRGVTNTAFDYSLGAFRQWEIYVTKKG